MNAPQKLTTVIQMPRVATHHFLTVVLAILATLGMDFHVSVEILTVILLFLCTIQCHFITPQVSKSEIDILQKMKILKYCSFAFHRRHLNGSLFTILRMKVLKFLPFGPQIQNFHCDIFYDFHRFNR